jgi:hypothetical protein
MFEYDLPYYFAGIPFTARQVPRKLAWLLARGEIRQILKDVYVDVRVRDSPQLRADGLRLVVPPDAVVCGRAAAWLHGIDTTALGPGDLMQAQWTRQVADLDVVEVDGLRVTSPATTALALAMQLPRPFALSAVDAFLRSGRADRWALRSAFTAYEGRPGYRQSQDILQYADRRAASPAESWLRLRLLDAGFGRHLRAPP